MNSEILAANSADPNKPQVHGLGIVAYSYMTVWQPEDALALLEHCHALGAAGIQAIVQPQHALALRTKAEELGMYIEAIVPMPDSQDTAEFEQGLLAAREAGAVALRSACLNTRRYETFHSVAAWQDHVARSIRSIEAALPLLEQYKIPLGLENHKDWTGTELLPLMRRYAGEYFGVCLDLGNNISLLDDPVEFIDQLAPYAVSTHVKDMAVEPCAGGFLMAEVPLGTGFLNLPDALRRIRKCRPDTRYSLEMITRDPLRIPCLEDGYWKTFGERDESRLERTLNFVHAHRAPALPRITHLSWDQQKELADQNIVACLRYARSSAWKF